MSGVFIFPLTPGLEESVVNGLLHRGQLPCWNSSSCGTEESAVGQACVSENKQSSARSLLPSIHQHSLMSGSVEGVSSAPGPVPVSSITFKIVMPPSHPGSLLPCKQRNGLGQALCQPVGGGDPRRLLCDTMLKGAAIKSSVIVESRPSNEAAAFTLLFIGCCSGTLCSLFTDS